MQAEPLARDVLTRRPDLQAISSRSRTQLGCNLAGARVPLWVADEASTPPRKAPDRSRIAEHPQIQWARITLLASSLCCRKSL